MVRVRHYDNGNGMVGEYVNRIYRAGDRVEAKPPGQNIPWSTAVITSYHKHNKTYGVRFENVVQEYLGCKVRDLPGEVTDRLFRIVKHPRSVTLVVNKQH